VTDRKRRAGRPRSQEADDAILAAALELLIDRGPMATSIEQVASAAGVTRPTVYRRYPDKTALLIAAVEASYGNPPSSPQIRDVEHLITGWAHVLSDPRRRRLLRRLYASRDDCPELAHAYRTSLGEHRDQARHKVFDEARRLGQLPPDTDPDVLLDVLSGAVWQHLVTRPDSATASEIDRFLRAVLQQVGYRPHRTT
jgi:AcrR family transcriptional regulator